MAKEKSGYVTFDAVKQTNVPIEESNGKVTIIENIEVINETLKVKNPVVYNNSAFSMSECNGAWQVVEIEYNDRTLESAPAKIIERNTEKSIINERLQILLLGRDFI